MLGIRLFTKKRADDDLEAKALQYRRDIIDIYSNSWGPVDNGYSVEGPGRKTKLALQEGVRKVRFSYVIDQRQKNTFQLRNHIYYVNFAATILYIAVNI